MMEILKYTIPAVLVLIVTYYLLKIYFNEEREKRVLELRKTNSQIITPARLRAYERLTLYLERIKPNNMLMHQIGKVQSYLDLQTTLLEEIKREFEHNVTQQIYVGEEIWEELINARENLIQLINVAASQCNADDSATKLATIIIEAYNMPEITPIDNVLHLIRKEVKDLFYENKKL